MKFILGKKLGMTRIFGANGKMVGVTIIEAGPVMVTHKRDVAKDGYAALQLGFGSKKRATKAEQGHLKKNNIEKNPLVLREFKLKEETQIKTGDVVNVSIFKIGDKVTISGVSKGKGFQGGMKRHGFKGGPASHGQKHSAREVGSIGASGRQRVLKGTRMAGRMGQDRVTVSGLVVERVDPEHNLLAVRGAVPGVKGAILEVSAR